MVTTQSRQPSSSAGPDHSPSCSVRRRFAADPSLVVMSATSQSRPSSSWRTSKLFLEFYANFSDVSAASVALSGLVVHVYGIPNPFNFHFISAALGMAPIRSGSS
ncbi:unnamed protein product [Prunus armeniaca]|uniref:Uncharacterized protein n=1 Tax=Prunus armeniaca TaxID=36596 RepID=A0A6J5UB52_PRUAR|nr:unnamed protein product [Prunus armeniaca]CAB4304058.1 unnamed protein product [Prunus armeniaca]